MRTLLCAAAVAAVAGCGSDAPTETETGPENEVPSYAGSYALVRYEHVPVPGAIEIIGGDTTWIAAGSLTIDAAARYETTYRVEYSTGAERYVWTDVGRMVFTETSAGYDLRAESDLYTDTEQPGFLIGDTLEYLTVFTDGLTFLRN